MMIGYWLQNLPKTKVWGGCDDQNGVIFDFSGEPAQSFAFSTGKENFMTIPSIQPEM